MSKQTTWPKLIVNLAQKPIFEIAIGIWLQINNLGALYEINDIH